jgi:hypothetical protein
MLVGMLAGALLVLLLFAIVFLIGMVKTLASQVRKANKELFETQTALGRFVYLEQERQKIKESISFNFTEEQITTLANRIGSRCVTLHNSEQAAALNKLD